MIACARIASTGSKDTLRRNFSQQSAALKIEKDYNQQKSCFKLIEAAFLKL